MPVIGVCSSALETNVGSVLSLLRKLEGVEVKFIKLPYNDLDNFRLTAGSVDGIILCHSIHNRRFSITDVLDAHYNKFLPHARDVLGKQNVAVIGHDFAWPLTSKETRGKGDHSAQKKALMNSFRVTQPTAFECSSLTLVCGKLDSTGLHMDKEDQDMLIEFGLKVRPREKSPGSDDFAVVLGKWFQIFLVWTIQIWVFPYLPLFLDCSFTGLYLLFVSWQCVEIRNNGLKGQESIILVVSRVLVLVQGDYLVIVVLKPELTYLQVCLLIVVLVVYTLPLLALTCQIAIIQRSAHKERKNFGDILGPRDWSSYPLWQIHYRFWVVSLSSLSGGRQNP
ncbi:uncharacterized protein [Diadema antillarum]|uniref:uncharacterized protein n=1 Tax=Diadema antillarum TaxID=105358 RepID=UPI003A8B8FB0